MTLPASSRMASVLTKSHRKHDLMNAAAKVSSTFPFSTLTSKNVWSQGKDELERGPARPSIQLTMSPRQYGTSSVDDAQYIAGWTNSLRLNSKARTAKDASRGGWTTAANIKDSEFDPILNIRAMNPLMFESNYDLEEYGPSFGQKVDQHDVLIQEWRIRYDRAV